MPGIRMIKLKARMLPSVQLLAGEGFFNFLLMIPVQQQAMYLYRLHPFGNGRLYLFKQFFKELSLLIGLEQIIRD